MQKKKSHKPVLLFFLAGEGREERSFVKNIVYGKKYFITDLGFVWYCKTDKEGPVWPPG